MLEGNGQRVFMRNFDPRRDPLYGRLEQRFGLGGRKSPGSDLRRQEIAALDQQERLAAPVGIGQAKCLRLGGAITLDQSRSAMMLVSTTIIRGQKRSQPRSRRL